MIKIQNLIKENIEVKNRILSNARLLSEINDIAHQIIAAFKNNHQLLLCGNGGSASDAQHLAAEFTGRFYLDRQPLNAEALHCNTSYLTAVANDYSYDETYSRLVKAKGRKGDILIGLSTSGNSSNIIKAIETANGLEMITIGMTGESGGIMKDKCKFLVNVPSNITPRIQEAHILIGHIICEIVEETIFHHK
jgi:D-sedoheptulose 7-phosphate isomerase